MKNGGVQGLAMEMERSIDVKSDDFLDGGWNTVLGDFLLHLNVVHLLVHRNQPDPLLLGRHVLQPGKNVQVNVSQLLANRPIVKLFHSQIPVLSHNLENILPLLLVLDSFLHQLFLLLFDLLLVKQAASLFHILLGQDDVLEVLVRTLMGVSKGFLDER